MANFKDFAIGLVVTPPSPATTGTSITLRAGDGASMPTPPFYVTVTPPGQLTTLGTSEKLLVTAVAGDTLTVTRAQDGTTAKSIDVNWIVANAVYAKDVFSSSIKMDELLTGTINGTNKVFTTASAFTSIVVYKNGVTLHLGDDYTITGTNQITMVTAPATGTKLTATYILGTSVMIQGSNSMIKHEVPAGTIDGTNKLFTLARGYIAGTLEVYVNGVRQSLNAGHYTETNPTAGTFTFSDAPLVGDIVSVAYQFIVSVSGNADTVDGYHANATPTANQLFPLGSDGKIPTAAFQGIKTYSMATVSTNVGTTDTAYYSVATFTIPATDVPTGHNYYVFVSGTSSYNHGGTTGGAQVYARINVNNTNYTKASITGVAGGQYFVGPLTASYSGQLTAGTTNTISLEVSKDFTSGASVNFGAWGSFNVLMVAI